MTTAAAATTSAAASTAAQSEKAGTTSQSETTSATTTSTAMDISPSPGKKEAATTTTTTTTTAIATGITTGIVVANHNNNSKTKTNNNSSGGSSAPPKSKSNSNKSNRHNNKQQDGSKVVTTNFADASSSGTTAAAATTTTTAATTTTTTTSITTSKSSSSKRKLMNATPTPFPSAAMDNHPFARGAVIEVLHGVEEKDPIWSDDDSMDEGDDHHQKHNNNTSGNSAVSVRLCDIIDRVSIGDGKWRYYVHYRDFNRRMDEWISMDRIVSPPSVGNAKARALKKEEERQKRKHGRSSKAEKHLAAAVAAAAAGVGAVDMAGATSTTLASTTSDVVVPRSTRRRTTAAGVTPTPAAVVASTAAAAATTMILTATTTSSSSVTPTATTSKATVTATTTAAAAAAVITTAGAEHSATVVATTAATAAAAPGTAATLEAVESETPRRTRLQRRKSHLVDDDNATVVASNSTGSNIHRGISDSEDVLFEPVALKETVVVLPTATATTLLQTTVGEHIVATIPAQELDEHEGLDEASLREHEEVTKVKNVSFLELGPHRMETWYFSPLPKELLSEKGFIEVLYCCEFTLSLFARKSELQRFQARLPTQLRHPPGNEIYRNGNLSMFEVDGYQERIYSQNLSYIAKLFLDHKTLYFDVDPFLFYVLCEVDNRGFHIVGYFSKEKYSDVGYNLACILTFPSHQRKGYGRFLIAFSYELSKREEKVGSPEKPMSDLGQQAYKPYWASTIVDFLLHQSDESNMSIMDISKRTSIMAEDIVFTLNQLGILKIINGLYFIAAERSLLERLAVKYPVKEPRVDPSKLHWTPFLTDIKRDKFSIHSKKPRMEEEEENAAQRSTN